MELKESVAALAQDEDVRLWLENLRSASAKRIYAESLARFCENLEMNPREVVSLFENDQVQGEKRLQGFIQASQSKFAPKTLNNILVGVKSWLRHNGIIVKRKINVGNTRLTPTIEGEAPPSQSDLARILEYADVRGKAAIALISFAGLRPETAVSLRIRDLPELMIKEASIGFRKIPTIITVRPQVSKNRRGYLTFLVEQGCSFLREYLLLRQRRGEALTPESPLIRESGKGGKTSFSRKGFSRLVKRIFERAGFKGRPYVLRSFFDTAIMNARTVPYDYQHFWMGHTGTIEATYTVNKRLPDWQIEEMRKAFKEAVEPRLTTQRVTSEHEVVKQANIEALKVVAENMFGLKLLEVKVAKEREEGRSLTLDETMKLFENELKRLRENPKMDPQEIVAEKELKEYLENGWEFVSVLPSQKILIRK